MKKKTVNRDQRPDITEIIELDISSFDESNYLNSSVKSYGAFAVRPDISESTFVDLQIVGTNLLDVSSINIIGNSASIPATIVSKTSTHIHMRTPSLPGPQTYSVDLVEASGRTTQFWKGLNVGGGGSYTPPPEIESSGEGLTVEPPPGTASDDSCDGYDVTKDAGGSTVLISSTDSEFTSGSDVCFRNGTFTFDRSMQGFSFGHLKILASANFKHISNFPGSILRSEEIASGEGRRIHLKVKSYVQHGQINPTDNGYENKSGKSHTIGNLAIVDMNSTQQLSILGKEYSDFNLTESGGSHGGRGGAKIPYEAPDGYGDLHAPKDNGSSGAVSGKAGGAVEIESEGVCHFKGQSPYASMVTVKTALGRKGNSGGSIFFKCDNFFTENLSGQLLFNANGGTGDCGETGGGGGGRISLITTGSNGEGDWGGDLNFPMSEAELKTFLHQVQARGGWFPEGQNCSSHERGGAGTIYLEHSGHRTTGENLGPY